MNLGLDINARYGVHGVFPIDAAINSDDPNTLAFVIAKGADVDIEYGLPLKTALDYCIDGMIQNNRLEPYPESLEMVRTLLRHGADISIRDLNGKRPIDLLNVYASKPFPLERLKEIFRSVIPDLDEQLVRID